MMKVSAVDYKIEVMKAPEDEGGFLAYVPQLKCWGDGDTVQEAMADVIAVANDLIEIAMEDGVRIPEPDKIKVDEEFSGKLSLRLPKYLHAEVAKRAEEEDCSINQLIQSFIAMGIGKKYGEQKITINVQQQNRVDKVQKALLKSASEDIWKRQLFSNLDNKLSN